MITFHTNDTLCLTAHSVDAAGTVLLAFRQLPPIKLTVSWPDASWRIEIHPQHEGLSLPHLTGHFYRSHIIRAWKSLLNANRTTTS